MRNAGVEQVGKPQEIHDPATDRVSRGQHPFPAGSITTLPCRISDGQFVGIELSSKQLEEFASSEGDEIAVRF